MKKIIFVNGPMGIGKTSVSFKLTKLINNARIVHGDDCWDFSNILVNDFEKGKVFKTIASRIDEALINAKVNVVIVDWVMHKKSIISLILNNIKFTDYEYKIVTLISNEEQLITRLQKDIKKGKRNEDGIEISLSYLKYYTVYDDILIDTSYLSVDEIANIIISKITSWLIVF